MHPIKKVLLILTRADKVKSAQVILLAFTSALAESTGILSVMPFLTVVSDLSQIHSNDYLATSFNFAKSFLAIDERGFVAMLGIGALLFFVLSTAIRAYNHYFLNRFVEMQRHSISKRVLTSYLTYDFSLYLKMNSGEALKTSLSEVEHFVGTVLRPLFRMASQICLLLVLMATVIFLQPTVALTAACVLGLVYVIAFVFVKSLLTRLGNIQVDSNTLRHIIASETLKGMSTIKVGLAENYFLQKFNKPSFLYADALAKIIIIKQIPIYVIEISIFLGVVLLTMFVVFFEGDASSNSKLLPTLALFGMVAYRIRPASQAIYMGVTSLSYAKAAIDNIYRTISNLQKHEVNTPSDFTARTGSTDLKKFKILKFQAVSFRYPGTSKPILNNIDFELPSSGLLGIHGNSGAGKSTFIKILVGLLRPTNGNIFIDEEPLKSNSLRNYMSYVPQNIFVFDASLAENVAFGENKEDINLELLEHCLELSGLSNEVKERSPEGYWESVGEDGKYLSGGQAQRLAIARALYSQKPIIVFDEATNGLDQANENHIIETLCNLSTKITVVIISHNRTVLNKCESIIRVENGKLYQE